MIRQKVQREKLDPRAYAKKKKRESKSRHLGGTRALGSPRGRSGFGRARLATASDGSRGPAARSIISGSRAAVRCGLASCFQSSLERRAGGDVVPSSVISVCCALVFCCFCAVYEANHLGDRPQCKFERRALWGVNYCPGSTEQPDK